jgi:SNF2 family DNA or RNA helicase
VINHLKDLGTHSIQENMSIDERMSFLPQRLNGTLIEPFQPEGCKWMLQRELAEEIHPPDGSFQNSKGGVLADEVGLGKTILSICMMILNPKPLTLVVLPKSLVMQWKEQIDKFTSFVTVHVLATSNDKVVLPTSSDKPTVYIISQSRLNSKTRSIGVSAVHGINWDRVFIDEAHMLRNKKSKLHKTCCLLRGTIKWALTATPVMNRMSDFVNLMAWVGVSQQLCQNEKGWVSSTFVLRRTKEDVSGENNLAPKCHVQVKRIPFASMEEAVLYSKVFMKERNLMKQETKRKKNVPELLEHLLRVRQLCIHPQLYLDGMSRKTKIPHGRWSSGATKLQELIHSIQQQPSGEKAIVFCQFVKEMDAYMSILSCVGITCIRLDGTMDMKQRGSNINRFTNDPCISTFVIQINTGGQGINLQVANHVYIMAPNWNPAVEYQAIGRCFRTGQTKDVHVTRYCITSGSEEHPFIEEDILQLHERKKRIISIILNDERIVNDGVEYFQDLSVGITRSDIEGLFHM